MRELEGQTARVECCYNRRVMNVNLNKPNAIRAEDDKSSRGEVDQV